MSSELLELIITIALGIATIVFAILWYRVQYGKLPETKEELSTAISSVATLKDKIYQVLSFFNPETSMSETDLSTIKEDIPAVTYKMTEESLNRVLETCDSEEEKARINALVVEYENPQVTGDECCVYEIKTSRALFKVSYGIPELIEQTTPQKLTQKQISEIIELINTEGNDYSFEIMWQVLKNERENNYEYYITVGETVVLVKDGNYEIE